MNGLCTIVDGRNGVILDHPELREIAESLLDEAVQVASLCGVALTEADRAAVFRSLETTRENVNATLQDLRAGRRGELELLNGAVVRAARAHGTRARANETILKLVENLSATARRREV